MSKKQTKYIWIGIFSVSYLFHIISLVLMKGYKRGNDILTNYVMVMTGTAVVLVWSNSGLPNICKDVAKERPLQGDGLNRPKKLAPPVQRYVFLDNMKTFLTAVVVTAHVCLNFWGNVPCYLHIGGWSGAKTTPLILLVAGIIFQSFSMTLFFLLSGFFAAASFDRKGGDELVRSKIKRLLVPGVFCAYIINPCAMIISNLRMDKSFIYLPHAGVAWYIFWLFIFCLVYSTLANDHSIAGKTSKPACAEADEHDLPKTKTRLKYGVLVCGIGMLLVRLIFAHDRFYGMPIIVGSFISDIFMFYIGILAYGKKWFDGRSLADKLDIPTKLLYTLTLVEGSFLALFAAALREFGFNFGLVLGLFIVGGMFNVDMNLALLTFFQAHFDEETSLSKKLAKASYTVYLIHPFILVCVTSLYVQLYNLCADENLLFEDNDSSEWDTGITDWGFSLGFAFVFFFTHAIVWPLSLWMSGLPVLKNYL